MTECTRCLYTTRHPFGLVIDESGVCSGCRVHEEKTSLDWAARFSLLEALFSSRRKDRRTYDCVVPIHGTPEYFAVLDVVVNRLGLRPLVVAYNSQFSSEVGIKNVDLMREIFNVDMVFYASNPHTYRKLVRESLIHRGSVMWPAIAGMTAFPVQIAVEERIPVVIWPHHQPTEQVGMHSYTHENSMSRRSRHDFDLMGVEPNSIATPSSLINPNDVEDLQYPTDAQLIASNVRGVYLANYIPWDSRVLSESAIESFGAQAAMNTRTFDTYDRISDMTYMTAHDLLKQAKLGYSRVTDSLVREIRFGRISRTQASEIKDYYQSEYPTDELSVFLDWVGMTHEAFRWILSRYRASELSTTDPVGLSRSSKAFVASFRTTADPVHASGAFTLFGKGLENTGAY